jgi:hypothetical protein
LAGPAQALAGEVEPVGVVDEAIEDGVGVGGLADERVPLVGRSWLVTRVERRP